MSTRSEEFIELMRQRGAEAYLGEAVSQLEHALQAAHLATQANSPPSLIAAALLHDIGHLLPGSRHEETGHEWVLQRFGPSVADPVRHHVAAKRYLCAVEPDYYDGLSPTSVRSLALQGGPCTEEEARAFEKLAGFREAVQLRRWDDAAKQPGLAVPPPEEYCTLLDRLPVP